MEIVLIIKRDVLRSAIQLQMNYTHNYQCNITWSNLNNFPGNNLMPDLVILDIEFYPALLSIPQGWSNSRWMVLVKEESDTRLIDALYSGANAFFVLKNEPKELINAIEQLMNKKEEPDIVHLIRNLYKKTKPVEKLNQYNLTVKETEILKLMTQGLHFKAIAMQTGNSYETIRTHVKRIYKKLEVETASEAVIKALNGLK